MSYPRCATCKHWELDDGSWQGMNSRRWCRSRHIGECGEIETEADSLEYTYSEGGGFMTGPQFGCVHHEAKVA